MDMYNKGFEDAQKGNYNPFYVHNLSPEDRAEYERGATLANGLGSAKAVGTIIQYIFFILYLIAINAIYFLPAILIIYYGGFYRKMQQTIKYSEFSFYTILPALILFIGVSVITLLTIKYIKGKEFANFFITKKPSKTFYLLTGFSLLSSASFALFIVYTSPEGTYINPWKYLLYLFITGMVVYGSYVTQFSGESYKHNLKKSKVYRIAFFATLKKQLQSINTEEIIRFINYSDFKKRDNKNIIMVVSIVLLIGFIIPYFLNQNKVAENKLEYYIRAKFDDSNYHKLFSVSDLDNNAIAPNNKLEYLVNLTNSDKHVLFKDVFDGLNWEQKRSVNIPIEYKLNISHQDYKLYGFFINNKVFAYKPENSNEKQYYTSVRSIRIYVNDKYIDEKGILQHVNTQTIRIKPVNLKPGDVIKLEISNAHYNMVMRNEDLKQGIDKIGISTLSPIVLSEADKKAPY